MRVATMVRGWIRVPAPRNVVYAPIAVAAAVATGLAGRGHTVDFYAPRGSRVPGVAVYDDDLDPVVTDAESFERTVTRAAAGDFADLAAADQRLARLMAGGGYDVLLFHHLEVATVAAAYAPAVPVVCVLWDPPNDGHAAYTSGRDNLTVIAVSDRQRRDAARLPVTDTIYPGIDCPPAAASHPGTSPRLLYVGRVVPEKGPDIAAEVAARTGARLDLLGPLRAEHRRFFEQRIRPRLNGRIRHRGPVPADAVAGHLSGAAALLMPIRWQEPFGMVMIEAMAHGVPVIGFRRGAVPEIVEHGVSGYVVDSADQMCEAVRALDRLPADGSRQRVRTRFSVGRMIDAYELALIRAMRR